MDVSSLERDEFGLFEAILFKDALLAAERIGVTVEGDNGLAPVLLTRHLIINLLCCLLDECIGELFRE